MGASESLKIASACLAIAVVCRLAIAAVSNETVLLNVFCLLPAVYAGPIAGLVGAIIGLWSIFVVALSFERTNRAELLLVACALVTLANIALLAFWLRQWSL
jgi:hypothetical protein